MAVLLILAGVAESWLSTWLDNTQVHPRAGDSVVTECIVIAQQASTISRAKAALQQAVCIGCADGLLHHTGSWLRCNVTD